MAKTYIDELAEEIATLREENRQLRKWCEEFNALDVAKENHNLKELLKECVGELAEFNNSYYPKTQALITKIDEVLKND